MECFDPPAPLKPIALVWATSLGCSDSALCSNNQFKCASAGFSGSGHSLAGIPSPLQLIAFLEC